MHVCAPLDFVVKLGLFRPHCYVIAVVGDVEHCIRIPLEQETKKPNDFMQFEL